MRRERIVVDPYLLIPLAVPVRCVVVECQQVAAQYAAAAAGDEVPVEVVWSVVVRTDRDVALLAPGGVEIERRGGPGIPVRGRLDKDVGLTVRRVLQSERSRVAVGHDPSALDAPHPVAVEVPAPDLRGSDAGSGEFAERGPYGVHPVEIHAQGQPAHQPCVIASRSRGGNLEAEGVDGAILAVEGERLFLAGGQPHADPVLFAAFVCLRAEQFCRKLLQPRTEPFRVRYLETFDAGPRRISPVVDLVVTGNEPLPVGLLERDAAVRGVGQRQHEGVSAAAFRTCFVVGVAQRQSLPDEEGGLRQVVGGNGEARGGLSVEIETERAAFVRGGHPDAGHNTGPFGFEKHLFTVSVDRFDPFVAASVVVGEPSGLVGRYGAAGRSCWSVGESIREILRRTRSPSFRRAGFRA